jgi:hypothetical protein
MRIGGRQIVRRWIAAPDVAAIDRGASRARPAGAPTGSLQRVGLHARADGGVDVGEDAQRLCAASVAHRAVISVAQALRPCGRVAIGEGAEGLDRDRSASIALRARRGADQAADRRRPSNARAGRSAPSPARRQHVEHRVCTAPASE